MNIKDMSMGKRLALGFGAVLFIFAISIGVVNIKSADVKREAVQVEQESVPFLMSAYEMDLSATDISDLFTDIALTREMNKMAEADKLVASFRENSAKFKEMFQKEKDQKSFDEMKAIEVQFNEFIDKGKHMINAYVTKGSQEGNAAMVEYDRLHDKLQEAIEHFKKEQADEAKKNAKDVIVASNSLNMRWPTNSPTATWSRTLR